MSKKRKAKKEEIIQLEEFFNIILYDLLLNKEMSPIARLFRIYIQLESALSYQGKGAAIKIDLRKFVSSFQNHMDEKEILRYMAQDENILKELFIKKEDIEEFKKSVKLKEESC